MRKFLSWRQKNVISDLNHLLFALKVFLALIFEERNTRSRFGSEILRNMRVPIEIEQSTSKKVSNEFKREKHRNENGGKDVYRAELVFVDYDDEPQFSRKLTFTVPSKDENDRINSINNTTESNNNTSKKEVLNSDSTKNKSKVRDFQKMKNLPKDQTIGKDEIVQDSKVVFKMI